MKLFSFFFNYINIATPLNFYIRELQISGESDKNY
jgi:hypothetical protein